MLERPLLYIEFQLATLKQNRCNKIMRLMEDPSQLGVATIAHNWVGTLVSNYQIDTNCLLQLVRAMDMKNY